jgi:hypothetical protein
MHSYASDSNDRRVAPWIIAVLSVFFTYIYVSISRELHVTLPWWSEAPSIMLVYAALHWSYKSMLWKVRIGRFFLSQIPNCNGTWYGELKSSHDSGTTSECMLFVHQTWTGIVCEFRTSTSVSFSRMAAFNVKPGLLQGLAYEYTNDPKSDASEMMHAHRGFAFLRLSADRNRFEGDYYTGRDRINYGTMQLKKISPTRLSFADARIGYKQTKKEKHER